MLHVKADMHQLAAWTQCYCGCLTVTFCAGTDGAMYTHDSHISYTGPSLDCAFLLAGKVAALNNCLEAIAEVHARGNVSCVVASNVTTQYTGGYRASLAHSDTCDVYLGAVSGPEVSMPCPQLVVYATNIVTACQDVNGDSGGSLLPQGSLHNASAGFWLLPIEVQ